jgi:hypothetical protein
MQLDRRDVIRDVTWDVCEAAERAVEHRAVDNALDHGCLVGAC